MIDLLNLVEQARPATLLTALRALTNLSASEANHGLYTRAVQELYTLLDADDLSLVLQAAKILVNLSTNQDMVPYLLAAKVNIL